MYMYTCNPMVKFLQTHPSQKKIVQISQNIDGFRQNIHKAFKIHKTLWEKPIRELFPLFTKTRYLALIMYKYNMYMYIVQRHAFVLNIIYKHNISSIIC